jgi:hypothetical protein
VWADASGPVWYVRVRVMRSSDGAIPTEREFRGHARFDVLAGHLVWLNCVEFDDDLGEYVNQNWTGWVATGAATDTGNFQSPGFESVRLSGVRSVEFRCPVPGCDERWEVGLLVPACCPEHDAEVELCYREFSG